ncbi:hypothetical protein HZS_3520 [Henneguya salminicola]|nr:hypothetical protein HZS_3520 [Henneguya salminicola]
MTEQMDDLSINNEDFFARKQKKETGTTESQIIVRTEKNLLNSECLTLLKSPTKKTNISSTTDIVLNDRLASCARVLFKDQTSERERTIKKVSYFPAYILKLEELTDENNRLIRIADEYNQKNEFFNEKCDQFYEETQYLDRAYKYTYNHYEELKLSYVAQKENEKKLLKSNTDLKSALSLAGSKITDLLKEINQSKLNYESEVSRLQTALKLNLFKINGLEKNIEELTRQKQELTLICEEFLNEKQLKI